MQTEFVLMMPSPIANRAPLSRGLVALVLLAGAAVFAGTLQGGFLGDDFVYISRFYTFPTASWPRLFVHEWSEGIWGEPLMELRPFAALTFMIDARVFGGAAWGYRLINLLLHLGCLACVMSLAHKYSGGRNFAAAAAGILFALHPAHAEAVAWITGRVDLLATFCALFFWVAAENWSDGGRGGYMAVAILTSFVGVFAKELFLAAPALLAARWITVGFRASRKIWWRRMRLLAGAAAVIIFYALCRRAAFGVNASSGGAPWRDPGSWGRQSSYLGWLAPILPFSNAQEFAHPLALGSMQVLLAVVAVVSVLALSLAAWRGQQIWGNMIFFSGLWYFVAVGGLLVVGYFSPRHLYFPTAGLAIGAGLFFAAWPRGKFLRGLLLVAVVGWFSASFAAALRPWRANGRLSNEMMSALHRDLEGEPLSVVVCIAVPEIAHTAWLWPWSSPQLFAEPFFSPLHPAEFVLEQRGNYFRSDDWAKDRHPIATLDAAPGAVVLSADRENHFAHRRVSRDELQSRLPALRARAQNGLSTEDWTKWVQDFFPP